jgi:hypothetical protein
MISDQQINEIFNEFLASAELSSWESDLSGPERQNAQRLFRVAVHKAIVLNEQTARGIRADQ